MMLFEGKFDGMTRAEKIELLNKAKDAYYNSSEEIMSDAEYDELERSVGLENKSYIGSAKGNYSVKHAFLMGSIQKTQIKEQRDGTVNWNTAADDIMSTFRKANNCQYIEATPKLDGCSFSLEFVNINNDHYKEG